MEPARLELATFCMPCRRAPNCAMAPLGFDYPQFDELRNGLEQTSELSDSNGGRGGLMFGMGDGEKNPLDPKPGGEAGGLAGEGHDGSAQGVG